MLNIFNAATETRWVNKSAKRQQTPGWLHECLWLPICFVSVMHQRQQKMSNVCLSTCLVSFTREMSCSQIWKRFTATAAVAERNFKNIESQSRCEQTLAVVCRCAQTCTDLCRCEQMWEDVCRCEQMQTDVCRRVNRRDVSRCVQMCADLCRCAQTCAASAGWLGRLTGWGRGLCPLLWGRAGGLGLCRQCGPVEGWWWRDQGGCGSGWYQHLRWDVVTGHFNMVTAI